MGILIKKVINSKEVYFYETELEDIDENIDIIKTWCIEKLMPYMTNKKINFNHNSYGLKHICERQLGFYVSNGQIKKVLAELGVDSYQEKNNPNCCYPISEKFYKNLEKQPTGDVYIISKDKIVKIKYKDDVDIIYTSDKFIVCKKGSIKDYGSNLAFIYDEKGKCER